MALAGLISLNTNFAFSQQVKKKIVRVIEVDGNGERVVKEFDVSNNTAKFDSIAHDVHKKMKIEQMKLDSLEHILRNRTLKHFSFPIIPDFPPMPDFEFDVPEIPSFGFNDNRNFEFFTPDSTDSSTKIYYSEKSIDNSENLAKILEDLEKGTFDPQKWDMKEVEKNKIKDFKTKGKGEVIILDNHSMAPQHFEYFHGNPYMDAARARADMRRGRNRMIYFNDDSLNKKDFGSYSIRLFDDFDEPNCDNVYSISSSGKKNSRKIVLINDDKITKIIYSKPSDDEMKMLEKAGLAKEDMAKLLSPESLILLPKEGKDKYTVRFREKETGKVKVIITDDKGKALNSVEFEHSKGRTEKEIELKDLKPGTYFIQAQLNGKTTTSKLVLKVEEANS